MAKCKFPIPRIPATIGRTHKGADANFVGLGLLKSLSRNHCRIYYRDIHGGKLTMKNPTTKDTETHNTLKYIVPPPPAKKMKTEDNAAAAEEEEREVDSKEIILPQGGAVTSLPTDGFWVIQCLGKNKIFVGGVSLSKGQVAILQHGTTLRVGTHLLYFLLPERAPHQILKVPNPSFDPAKRKSVSKKTPSKGDDILSTIAVGGLGGAVNDMHEHYGARELMQIMDEAIRFNHWERRHQMIGTAVAYHAVRDAGKSKEIQHIHQREGGASRSEIMKWIKNSSKYKTWFNHMSSKMEFKSFQSSIGKALAKAGFERTGTTGRYVRWILPKDVPITHKLDEAEEKKKVKTGNEDDEEEEEDEVDSGPKPGNEEDEEDDQEDEDEEQDEDQVQQEGEADDNEEEEEEDVEMEEKNTAVLNEDEEDDDDEEDEDDDENEEGGEEEDGGAERLENNEDADDDDEDDDDDENEE